MRKPVKEGEGQKSLNISYAICFRWLSGKESACQAGGVGLIPGPRRSPGEGNGNPLQYSCLGKYMDTEAWRVAVHGVSESEMTERQSTHT